MNNRFAHQPMSTQSHGNVGVKVFIETHRRVLGGEFGRIPIELSDDAFSMSGYCIDAHEIMPAGSTEFHRFGPDADEWVARPVVVARMRGEGK
jgi:hypothetical protein